MKRSLMSHLKNRTVDANRFSMVPGGNIPRSAFDTQHTHKTTFDAGWLVPIYVDEVLPGDSMRVHMTGFARLATPITPVMDNLVLESFFFFVPNRLVWDHAEQFFGQQDSPGVFPDYLIPQVMVPAAPTTSIYDYFGVYVTGAAGLDISVNALPLRGYSLIWNEFFRDQDLQEPVSVPKGDGPDVSTTYQMLRRNKRPDYFTTARPWPEKPTANLDTGSLGLFGPGLGFSRPHAGAPVSGLAVLPGNAPTTAGQQTAQTGNRDVTMSRFYSTDVDTIVMNAQPAGSYPDVRVLINDIRTANAIQLILERNARSGTRYTEFVRGAFGVTSPDARLQRPEYLGGGRSYVNVAPIAQTSGSGATGTTTVLGELAGIGTAVLEHGFSGSFTEHGYIIGVINVRGDLTYQQGVNRLWWRRSRYDFYEPGLAHLGEQVIKSREIYCDGTGNATGQVETVTGDQQVFGYQERWAEYKWKPSRVSGRFRSDATSPLDMWHFAQFFAVRPLLNSAFIQEDPPVDRVLQTSDVPGDVNEQFFFDSLFHCRMVRPMPMYSIPGLALRL